MKGEDALTAWLRERLGPDHLLGDDAAVLPPTAAGERLVATVDSQVAGVHHPGDLDPALAARRLLAVNLSDAAAMGADPAWALLALSGPPELDRKRYFQGLLAACEEFGVTLAGGDLAGTEDTAIGTLTLLARLPAGRPPLRRSTARPGHGLWVAGTLGESALGQRLVARGARMVADPAAEESAADPPAPAGAAAGGGQGAEDERRVEDGPAWRVAWPQGLELPEELSRPAARAVRRHLDPAGHLAEQLRLGRALAQRIAEGGEPGAAMDLSDGPGTDLPRLCRASGVDAEIDTQALPLAPHFEALCRHLDLDPLDLALGGGEDYVLLFTLPEGTPPPAGFPATRIGTITARQDGAEEAGKEAGEAAITVLQDGSRRPLETRGWDHLE